jgi:hypothetical protein
VGSSPRVGGFLLNNREVDITQGFCPEADFPPCCRFISEELFRDLLSPNGYISGYLNLLRLFNLQRFLRSSTLPRYYPFGLSKSRNNSSLINLQHRGKPAPGQNPYVISTSWLFRRINPPTPGYLNLLRL